MFSHATSKKILLLISLFFSFSALADVSEADKLSQGLRNAKTRVDTIIQQMGGTPGGTINSYYENDATALPILIQASGSLFSAAENSDGAKVAFLSGAIALANFRFSKACLGTGLSRSQVSRARTAALTFPLGFLAPFGPELGDIVNELFLLKLDVGCP